MRIRGFLGGANVRILLELSDRANARYSDLVRLTRSRSTLSSVLKELEEEHLVKRSVVSTRPFQVHYSLTEKGRRIVLNFKSLNKELES